MNILRYVIILIMPATLFVSCKNDNYLKYNSEDRIQFGPVQSKIYLPSYNLEDTLKPYSFAYTEAIQDTVFFDVYAIGKVAQRERPLKLEQVLVDGVENAIPGAHYQDFNVGTLAAHYRIEAGKNHTRVPVVVLRHPSLQTKTVTLKLKVADNEFFKVGEPIYTWRKIELTDRLSQPAAWTPYLTTSYFGEYSVVKHRFMIEQTGERWDQDFITEVKYYATTTIYWQGVLKAALAAYNNTHPNNPLTDEFGNLVIFP